MSDPERSAADAWVGRTLGEFVVQERIGEGGFGAVYRATQPLLGREAVIKVLLGRFQAKPEMVQRFLREAKVASRLNHPFAAHIYAFGAEPDGALWIAMELVRGTPLDKLLLSGALSLERLVPLVERICDVVQSAHEQGIVHRDLKPGNVMVLSRAGRYLPKLLDLGIAKLTSDAPATPISSTEVLEEKPLSGETTAGGSITQHGEVLGSPTYMAPEQWVNAPTVGPQTDLYALGILIYEALTGRPPFQGRTMMAMARAHAQAAPPPVGAELPAALDGFFARALAKKTTDRFANAIELATALRSASGLESVDAELPRLPEMIVEAALAAAPQPIAEAMVSLGAARQAHQALDAAWMIVTSSVRYLSLLALAARAQVGAGGAADTTAVQESLRALRRRALRDEEWLELARELCRPFATRREAHPLPELVALFFEREGAPASTPPLEELFGLRGGLPQGARADEAQVRGVLSRVVPAIGRLLGAIAFLHEYPLCVPKKGALEPWMGPRRRQRATIPSKRALPDGEPVLCSADGVAVLALSPLFVVAPPIPSAPDELFLFDGQGRLGPRHVALPDGFERRDERVWTWLAERVFDAGSETRSAASEERAPYRGLSAFTTDDADLFVGREREVEAFVNTLRSQPFAAVVGPSGAGKSSFVYAGVIPSLPEGWRALSFRPGPSPIASLVLRLQRGGIDTAGLEEAITTDAGALGARLRRAAGDRVLVLVVDQFEEIFTLCADPSERIRFADALLSAARSTDAQLRLILTMRDDFLIRAEQLPALRARLAQSLQLVTTPSEGELERVLVEPARRLGYEFEDRALPREMAAQVASLPGALPLLSFTAAKLWELRDRNFKQLRRAAYQTLGGVGGALAQHAEQTLSGLLPEEQRLVREAFRHLVTSEGTRAVLTRSEIIQVLGGARSESVLEKLVAARLLVVSEAQSGEDRVEVVHEALLSAWPRLVEWRREDQEGARLRDQLRAAAKQWDERGRPAGLLWRGQALAELELWRKKHVAHLPAVDEAFASASLVEAQRGRRARALVVAGIIVVLSTALFFVVGARNRAARNAELAQASLAEMHEEQGRALAVADDPMRALVYLSAAHSEGRSGAAIDFLIRRSIEQLEAQRAVMLGHTDVVTFATFSPDDRTLVTASYDGSVRLWDVAGAEQRCELRDGATRVYRAEVSPDGAVIVSASADGVARLWDTKRCSLVRRLVGHRSRLYAALFSSDSRRVLTSSEDGTVRLWDAATGTERSRLLGHTDGAIGVLDTKGDLVATGDGKGIVRLWRARDGKLVARLDGHAALEIVNMHFSADGRRLVTAGADATARIWDIAGRAQPVVLRGHVGALGDAVFSPDGRWVITSSVDGDARLFDAASGDLRRRFVGSGAPVSYVRFARDGAWVAAASEDGTIRLWETDSGRQIAILSGHTGPVRTIAFSHDGARIVSAGADHTARVWSPQPQGKSIAPSTLAVDRARFDASGSRVALVNREHGARVVDVETGRVERSYTPPAGSTAMDVSRDGSLAVVASNGELLRVDIPTGAIRDRRPVTGPVLDLVVAPDGHHCASLSGANDVALWELGSAEPARLLRGHESPVTSLLFAHDSGLLVTTSQDHTARLWRLDAERAPTVLRGHVLTVNAAGLAAATALAVTVSDDKTGIVWDRDTGHSRVTLTGHRNEVGAAALSSSGQLAATGGTDGEIIVWDARRGQPLARLRGHGGVITALEFAPSDRTLLSAALDGEARLWGIGGPTAAARVAGYAACRVPFVLEAGGLKPIPARLVGCDPGLSVEQGR